MEALMLSVNRPHPTVGDSRTRPSARDRGPFRNEDHNDELPVSLMDANWRGIPGSWVLGAANTDVDPTNITSSTLFRDTGSLGIYRCPADPTAGKHPKKNARAETRFAR